MKRTLLLSTALILSGTFAFALTPDSIAADLSAQGYTRIEIRTGATQTKVEAIKGTQELEIIYDTATGAVLKQEINQVDPGENTSPGVVVTQSPRDFVDYGSSDDNGSDHGPGHDSNDDNGGDRDDDDSDDGAGHDSNDDKGGDRDDDDSDDGAGHDSNDDKGGDRDDDDSDDGAGHDSNDDKGGDRDDDDSDDDSNDDKGGDRDDNDRDDDKDDRHDDND